MIAEHLSNINHETDLPAVVDMLDAAEGLASILMQQITDESNFRKAIEKGETDISDDILDKFMGTDSDVATAYSRVATSFYDYGSDFTSRHSYLNPMFVQVAEDITDGSDTHRDLASLWARYFADEMNMDFELKAPEVGEYIQKIRKLIVKLLAIIFTEFNHTGFVLNNEEDEAILKWLQGRGGRKYSSVGEFWDALDSFRRNGYYWTPDVFAEFPELEVPFMEAAGPAYALVPEDKLNLKNVKAIIDGSMTIESLLESIDGETGTLRAF